MSKTEFRWAETKAPEQLFKALSDMQGRMRRTILGEDFWVASVVTKQGIHVTPMEAYNAGGTFVRLSNAEKVEAEWEKTKKKKGR